MRRTEEEEFRDSAKPRDGPKSWFNEPPSVINSRTLKRNRRRRTLMALSLILLGAILVVLSFLGLTRWR